MRSLSLSCKGDRICGRTKTHMYAWRSDLLPLLMCYF